MQYNVAYRRVSRGGGAPPPLEIEKQKKSHQSKF